MRRFNTVFMVVALAALLGSSAASAQQRTRGTADSVRRHFTAIHKQLLEMAKDFPEDKYDYKLKPEMRTFGAVLVHVTSGLVYAAKAGRGEKVKWDELEPKDYKDKAAVLALLEKSLADAETVLKGVPDEALAKSVEPSVLEHSAEHYGLLVAYYRANGLVPPESRKPQQ
ncbi:MAG: hypothetical protein NVS9B4_23280 [Candidatus Acidiferrum sp.]